MHSWLKAHSSQPLLDESRSDRTLDFCNKILTTPGSTRACKWRYPHQRYSQVNMVPLWKFGTLEFRAHSASYDQERILRWTQFLLAFVEHFGLGGGANTGMSRFFTSGSEASDYRKLQRAQQMATSNELFDQLATLIDRASKKYYKYRKWEITALGCSPGGAATTWRADSAVGGPA